MRSATAVVLAMGFLGCASAPPPPAAALLLENEGHGFSRNDSRLLAYTPTDRFLDRYIFGDTSVVVLPSAP
ncbi:MAG: hypothetical protein ACLQDQ_00925 [Myxococcaceae bacterium]